MISPVRNSLIDQIHQEALAVVGRYKTSEIDLIDVLQKVDRHKVYHALMYRSLFHYATSGLGLAEEIAYAFINVSRKAKEIPELREEIRKGTVSVTKAKRLTAVINSKNQAHWLELAKTCSKQKLEREIALASPIHAVVDRLTYVHPDSEIHEKTKVLKLNNVVRVQLVAGISEGLMLDIRRVQDIVSQKLRRPATLEEVLKALTDTFLRKDDPIRRAERHQIRTKSKALPGKSTPQPPGNAEARAPIRLPPPPPARTALSADLKHQVIRKYQGQCGFLDSAGTRCTEKRFLEIHHIEPLSAGGRDELKNLKLLCSGHHKVHHNKNNDHARSGTAISPADKE